MHFGADVWALMAFVILMAVVLGWLEIYFHTHPRPKEYVKMQNALSGYACKECDYESALRAVRDRLTCSTDSYEEVIEYIDEVLKK